MSSSNGHQKRPKKVSSNGPKLIEKESTPPNKKIKVAECSRSGMRIRIVRENDDGNDVPVTGDARPKYAQEL